MSYGVEIWCAGALYTGRLARGKMAVIQALYRRLITPRGTLRGGDDEAAYGFDVTGYIGAVGYDTALSALPGLVRGELLKDDRVSDIAVAVTKSVDASGLISIVLDITGVLADEDEDFAFTVAATETTATLLGGVTS